MANIPPDALRRRIQLQILVPGDSSQRELLEVTVMAEGPRKGSQQWGRKLGSGKLSWRPAGHGVPGLSSSQSNCWLCLC